MISNQANPLNYKLPEPKSRVGINLPKSVYLCRTCSDEFEPWVLHENNNKWIMTFDCNACRQSSAD